MIREWIAGVSGRCVSVDQPNTTTRLGSKFVEPRERGTELKAAGTIHPIETSLLDILIGLHRSATSDIWFLSNESPPLYSLICSHHSMRRHGTNHSPRLRHAESHPPDDSIQCQCSGYIAILTKLQLQIHSGFQLHLIGGRCHHQGVVCVWDQVGHGSETFPSKLRQFGKSRSEVVEEDFLLQRIKASVHQELCIAQQVQVCIEHHSSIFSVPLTAIV
mmetsp:Transcript_22499/g.54089  ORF Transcript_22499/g.54089 Transcript_22499/m.54089 type:complete len:218 (-) Transcript_22499:3095-3748(-)